MVLFLACCVSTASASSQNCTPELVREGETSCRGRGAGSWNTFLSFGGKREVRGQTGMAAAYLAVVIKCVHAPGKTRFFVHDAMRCV